MNAEYKYHLALAAMGISEDEEKALAPAELQALFRSKARQAGAGRSEFERSTDSVMIRLAGREYLVKLRPYKEDFEWRRRLGELISRYIDSLAGVNITEFRPESDLSGLVKTLLPRIFGEAIDDLIELMFLYAPELPREQIDAQATTAELVGAAIKVFKLGLPFFYAAVGGIMELIPKSANPSLSPGSRS